MSRTTSMPARLARVKQAVSRPRRLTRTQLKNLERELRRERAKLEQTMTAAGAGAATPLMARWEEFESLPDTDDGLPVLLKSRILGRHQTLVAALRRLEAGTFGVCLGCDEPIPFGRLSVMPEATHCIRCGGQV
jgi:RNA polymerase-binding transcription factor DksA